MLRHLGTECENTKSLKVHCQAPPNTRACHKYCRPTDYITAEVQSLLQKKDISVVHDTVCMVWLILRKHSDFLIF